MEAAQQDGGDVVLAQSFAFGERSNLPPRDSICASPFGVEKIDREKLPPAQRVGFMDGWQQAMSRD